MSVEQQLIWTILCSAELRKEIIARPGENPTDPARNSFYQFYLPVASFSLLRFFVAGDCLVFCSSLSGIFKSLNVSPSRCLFISVYNRHSKKNFVQTEITGIML
jgi:hypothetical protein